MSRKPSKIQNLRLAEQKRTMAGFGMAPAGLVLVLLLGWTTTCVGGGRASESADSGEMAAMHTNSRAVLVIPNQDCEAASFVLATVTRHIRDAERSALYIAAAEDQYDDGLQALIERDCGEGIEHLRASDRALQQINPSSELFMTPKDMR